MKNGCLFSRPMMEGLPRRMPSGPNREVFCPEWEHWTLLTHTGEGGKGK